MLFGREYVCTFENVAVTAAQDFFEINPADDKPIAIAGVTLSQTTDFGDAAEEGLRVSLCRLTATVTSGNGTAFTPFPLSTTDAAAGFAAEVNGTTLATTSGSLQILQPLNWNVRVPLEFFWPPDLRPQAKQGEAIVFRLSGAPADSITVAGSIHVVEYG